MDGAPHVRATWPGLVPVVAVKLVGGACRCAVAMAVACGLFVEPDTDRSWNEYVPPAVRPELIVNADSSEESELELASGTSAHEPAPVVG